MDHGSFWDTLSRQLENKGPDYTARCTFRNKPPNTGDNVFLPGSFPQSPIQEVQETVPLVAGQEKDLENVRERLPCDISVATHADAPEKI